MQGPSDVKTFDDPTETRATCANCLMARADWPRDARDPGPFDPSLKCCTYQPFLPNYTIAKLMHDGRSEGPLAQAFARGRLTPIGLFPAQETSRDFGRAKEDRCPFLNADAKCAIWSDRPSVCRSYFCVSDRGEAGQAAWRERERLGNQLEWTRAHEILWEMGFTDDEIEARTWAEWAGREREFFLRCHEINGRIGSEAT